MPARDFPDSHASIRSIRLNLIGLGPLFVVALQSRSAKEEKVYSSCEERTAQPRAVQHKTAASHGVFPSTPKLSIRIQVSTGCLVAVAGDSYNTTSDYETNARPL